MSNMSHSERHDIREQREIEYRQWKHDDLAEHTAKLEKDLVDTLYMLEAVRDNLDGDEIAEAYREGELRDFIH